MSRPLDFDPGTEAHYSNMGFVILRLVVERASGQPYEAFVRQHVLVPAGMVRTRMERDHAYLPEETRRYRPGGRDPFPPQPATNWLSTPAEMARFLTAIDGTGARPLIGPKSRREMLAPPPGIPPRRNGANWGLGLDVVQETPDGVRFGKNGGKAGVLAYVEHRPGDVDWVVMFNTSHAKGSDQPSPLAAAQREIPRAIEAVETWPDRDLFQP